MQKWVILAAIQFIVRQLAKFGQETDWDQVSRDFQARIQQILPDWSEGPFLDLAEAVISGVKAALAPATEDDWQAILSAAAEGRWPEVVRAVQNLLAEVWEREGGSPSALGGQAPRRALGLA